MKLKKKWPELPVSYYNMAAPVFDILSNKYLYRHSRSYAINQLQLKENFKVLNVPCGTGQNFEFMQHFIGGSGQIVGVDLSKQMLKQAEKKIKKQKWQNVILTQANASDVNCEWAYENLDLQAGFDAILCDFGLSNFDDWQLVLENLIQLLHPDGYLVVLDWHIAKPKLFWKTVEWLRIGRVDLPIISYMKKRLTNFHLRDDFAGNRIFVASGQAISGV